MIKKRRSSRVSIIGLGCAFTLFFLGCGRLRAPSTVPPGTTKLYWFVPDGLRADPDVFTLYKWAADGELPNIRRMMQEGSYGYSIPVFPSHTPVNFATLFTGVLPQRHGVADGPIHLSGYPLNVVPRTGFSSLAKTIDPFWFTLEQAGLIVSLLSIPGSTPPEINRGNVVKGRWGGWGTEFPAVIFHNASDVELKNTLGDNDKVFRVGPKLTQFIEATAPAADWRQPLPQSFAPVRELNLSNAGVDLHVLLVDGHDDGVENYDRAYLSLDRQNFLASVDIGAWSEWFSLDLIARGQKWPTLTKFKLIRLGGPNQFRVRLIYDGLNDSVTLPETLAADLRRAAGPMVDFVDNFPPQLVYTREDRATFLQESEMSFAWHRRAERFFLNTIKQDVFVQSIYSPNQMLTSRWWMGTLDPRGHDYARATDVERAQNWREVLQMYKHVDEMIGIALDRRPKEGYVVLSSDHGVVPLNTEVRLNNLFARRGWLKTVRQDGVTRIDWAGSRVVFLNMNHVFINSKSLAGDYRPSSGNAFESLRAQVIKALEGLQDEHGQHPLAAWHTRADAAQWGLPPDRIGDLVIANTAGFGWSEDLSADQTVLVPSLKSGYKQALLPDQERGLWTPFMVVGPGVRRGFKLAEPIHHQQQYPTLMRLLKIKMPYVPDGKVVHEMIVSD